MRVIVDLRIRSFLSPWICSGIAWIWSYRVYECNNDNNNDDDYINNDNDDDDDLTVMS